ncbi:plant/MNA5-17 protein, partial [Trifolium medium]|nr:plant/MNA5-17 protein [Trifolium medium]
SAPPFCGSTQEIRQTNEEISTSAACSTPNKADSSTLKSVSRDKLENHEDASLKLFVRTATGSEGAAASNPQPPRLPTFHA